MGKRMTLAGLALAALLASACASAEPSEEERDDRPYGSQVAVVERVVDADTVVLDVKESGASLAAGAGQEIQLLEMDAPETQTPAQAPECWGVEAARAAEGLLPAGATVYVLPAEHTVEGPTRGYVWLESGVLYNELAVREGLARAVPEVFVERLRVAEAEAKAANRGIWGPPCDYDAGAPPGGALTPGPPPP